MRIGWIKIHRKILDSSVWNNQNVFRVWMWCLLKASHKEYDMLVGGQPIKLKPGQFVFGREKAAKEIGLSVQQARTSLNILKKLKNLTIESTNKFSIITIINWETYQNIENKSNQQNNQQLTSYQPATNHKQECKNEKNNIYSRVINYLNQKTNSDFKSNTKKTKELIDARRKEGFDIKDFEVVIDFKCKQWINNVEMQDYLRPQTVFSNKFEGYLNAAKRQGVKSKKEVMKNYE